MRTWGGLIKYVKRDNMIFGGGVLLCIFCVMLLLHFYFDAYRQPYMMNEMIDLSQGWHYSTQTMDNLELDTLCTGPKLHKGETMTIYRVMDVPLRDAAILIRTNHQFIQVCLDGRPLFTDQSIVSQENPGMALHFITLPKDYLQKTLSVEMTSPYALYSGRTSPILLGTVSSLETYAISSSMRSIIMMIMCLIVGISTLLMTFVQILNGEKHPEYLAIGIFSIIWGLYYVCTEYIVFLFFPPYWVSVLSMTFYFTFQIPLVLYFYFSFRHYRKWMLPAVIVHGGFAAAAILLQIFNLVHLPHMVNANNILLSGLIYTIVLVILEALKGNKMMALSAPFLLIAYVSMLYNFYVFYTRNGVVPYSYRDTYLLLILSVLIYNVQQFFKNYYHNLRKNELLTLQNRQAKDSYEHIKNHLKEVGGLKHEVKNHFAALQTYLDKGRYSEAGNYLEKYIEQAGTVADAVYHDNFLINAVVDDLLRRAKKLGVQVELDLRGSPIHIAEPDLYSLFSNIVDNALEACAVVPEERERFIRLTIVRRKPYLSIICENSMEGEILREEGHIQSKKQGRGHGYGLWTVERIANAYNGFMDTDCDQKTFTITVALND